MEWQEFLELVAKMRSAQKEYFHTRSQSVMRESIALEKQVDAAISILKGETLL